MMCYEVSLLHSRRGRRERCGKLVLNNSRSWNINSCFNLHQNTATLGSDERVSGRCFPLISSISTLKHWIRDAIINDDTTEHSSVDIMTD